MGSHAQSFSATSHCARCSAWPRPPRGVMPRAPEPRRSAPPNGCTGWPWSPRTWQAATTITASAAGSNGPAASWTVPVHASGWALTGALTANPRPACARWPRHCSAPSRWPPDPRGAGVRTGYRHCDPRFPFLWHGAGQPAIRWHGSGDGPAHYFADTPVGAWAEFLRHEGITDASDLAGVRRSLWAVELPDFDEARCGRPALAARQLFGGLTSHAACQAAARGLRAAGAKEIEVRGVALLPGAARGWQADPLLRPATAARDAQVWVCCTVSAPRWAGRWSTAARRPRQHWGWSGRCESPQRWRRSWQQLHGLGRLCRPLHGWPNDRVASAAASAASLPISHSTTTSTTATSLATDAARRISPATAARPTPWPLPRQGSLAA